MKLRISQRTQHNLMANDTGAVIRTLVSDRIIQAGVRVCNGIPYRQ